MARTAADWNEERARELAAPHLATQGGLLPALLAIQREFGCIPKPAIALLADLFNLSRADVFGTASFYHDFRLEGRAGRHVLKLCRAEACQAAGCEALAESVKTRLGIDWHETTKNGEWTLEPVFCLGLCASGPSAMIDGEPAAQLDAARLTALLDEASR